MDIFAVFVLHQSLPPPCPLLEALSAAVVLPHSTHQVVVVTLGINHHDHGDHDHGDHGHGDSYHGDHDQGEPWEYSCSTCGPKNQSASSLSSLSRLSSPQGHLNKGKTESTDVPLVNHDILLM